MADWQSKPEIEFATVSALKVAIGSDAFSGMSQQFAADLESLCQAYGVARATSNSAGQRESAHALKGAAANIGLARLSALAADLEAGNAEDADQLEPVLVSAIAKLQEA